MGGSVFIGTRINGKIQCYDAHTSQICAFVDARVLNGEPEAAEQLRKCAEDSIAPRGVVAPYSYGLVFVDHDTRQIWSNQGYTSVLRHSSIGIGLELRNGKPGSRIHMGHHYFSSANHLKYAFESGIPVKAMVYDGGGEKEMDLQKSGLGSFEAIAERLADRDSELYEAGPDFIIQAPGWTYHEYDGDSDYVSIARQMAEAGILKGTAAETQAWDEFFDELDHDEDEDEAPALQKPGQAILSAMADIEARRIAEHTADGIAPPKPRKI